MRQILKRLLGGDRRSIGASLEVAADVLANPLLFPDLFSGMTSKDPLLRMRTADAVEKVTVHNPRLLQPLKKKLLGSVALIDQQEIRWHAAQLFSRVEWTKSERARIVRILQDYLVDKSSIVRTFAMQALADIAEKDRKLRPAILKRLRQLTESGTPAMRARGKKLLRRFEQIKPPAARKKM
jgi:hypothetical protein